MIYLEKPLKKIVKLPVILELQPRGVSWSDNNRCFESIQRQEEIKISKQQEKKKQEKTKYSDGVSNPSKDKEKKKKEKKKYTYYRKGWHLESACMKKTIDMMVKHLEKNNIPLPECTRKKEEGSSSENKDRCHALVLGSSGSSSFIIDSSSSRHMASIKYSLFSIHPYSGPSILMSNDS